MKKRNHFLLIEGTVYPFDTLISTAPYDDLIKYIERKKHYIFNDDEREKLQYRTRGRTVRLRGGQIVIQLPLEKTKIGIDVADLAHEIEHATFLLFDHLGIIHTLESDEAFAYHQAYLMRHAMTFFDEQMGRK